MALAVLAEHAGCYATIKSDCGGAFKLLQRLASKDEAEAVREAAGAAVAAVNSAGAIHEKEAAREQMELLATWDVESMPGMDKVGKKAKAQKRAPTRKAVAAVATTVISTAEEAAAAVEPSAGKAATMAMVAEAAKVNKVAVAGPAAAEEPRGAGMMAEAARGAAGKSKGPANGSASPSIKQGCSWDRQ